MSAEQQAKVTTTTTDGAENAALLDVTNSGDVNSLNDLTSLIQNVLHQTQERFQSMSDQVIRRIDDMTKRIDDLEKNINDLMTQAGVEQTTADGASASAAAPPP